MTYDEIKQWIMDKVVEEGMTELNGRNVRELLYQFGMEGGGDVGLSFDGMASLVNDDWDMVVVSYVSNAVGKAIILQHDDDAIAFDEIDTVEQLATIIDGHMINARHIEERLAPCARTV